jgi:hypothetical protein
LLATDPQDLLGQFTPQYITPRQVATRVLDELRNLSAHYASAVRSKLDLLFYVNLEEHFLKIGPMLGQSEFAAFGWRYVSAVIGCGGLVIFTNSNAPEFLHQRAGTRSCRKFQ